MSRLERDLRNLSFGYRLQIDERNRFLIVENVRLPYGYDRSTIPILIELPRLYPQVPPGVGDSHIYVPWDVQYGGRYLKDVHADATPSFPSEGWDDWTWAWLCYLEIDWNPLSDDLISFVEMVRADLTDPEVI